MMDWPYTSPVLLCFGGFIHHSCLSNTVLKMGHLREWWEYRPTEADEGLKGGK